MSTPNHSLPTYTAFAGDTRIASGDLRTMLTGAAERLRVGEHRALLVFEDWSGRQVDFDLRGTAEEIVARAEAARVDATAVDPSPEARRGRPKLGVVSREVSLLPRHWEWLESQPNGISAAIRRLVDEARKREPEKERARHAVEAASRFMSAMAGDRPGFEEASRALFAHDRERFLELVRPWPADVRAHLERLLAP
jgi:hypothetical protein